MPADTEKNIFDNVGGAVNRRQLLQGACGVAALALLGGCATTQYQDLPGLRAVVGPKNKYYGIATMSGFLSERAFSMAVKRECNMLVPESELKWFVLRPSPDQYDFKGYDRIADFAGQNNMKVRGHTLVWHEAMPKWANDRLNNKQDAEKMMLEHIKTVMAHTDPVIDEWDVVNEAIDYHSWRPDKLRESPWLHALGPDFIPTAFFAAHEAKPSAKLVYNDYGLEYADTGSAQKRAALLDLLVHLKQQNVPIHALGLQSHLECHRPLALQGLGDFLRHVKDMGLEVMITEMDVRTDMINAGQIEKTMVAADYVKEYLDCVQNIVPLNTVVTWGLSSRHSWIARQYPKTASPLPLDDFMDRLPMWDTLYRNWAQV